MLIYCHLETKNAEVVSSEQKQPALEAAVDCHREGRRPHSGTDEEEHLKDGRSEVGCERRGGVRVDRRTRRVAAHATDIRGVPQSQKTRMSIFSYWRVAGRGAAKNYGVAQDYLWIRS